MITNTKYLFFFSYILLVFGFFIGEDLNGNAAEDFIGQFPIIIEFSENFQKSFLNYDSLESGNSRQSPIFFFIFSLFYKIGFNEDALRFLNLNICFFSLLVFFLCMKKKYPYIKEYTIVLFSILISLSPSFRSLSIWPNGISFGLIFFLISIYFYLCFHNEKNVVKKFYFALSNILFVAISSYVSPNYSVFSIYFFFKYLSYYKQDSKIILIFFLNLCLAVPALIYLFYYDQLFFFQNIVSPNVKNDLSLNNLSNKISIITTIIFFHLIPYIFIRALDFKIYKDIKYYEILIYVVLVLFVIIFFNYPRDISGGGIFFKLSNYFFGNNILFYLTFGLSLFYISKTLDLNIDNIILIVCLYLSNPQFSIYHKYFDPLIFIIFFLLFKTANSTKLIQNYKYLVGFYFFYLIFISMSIYKIFYL